MPDNDKDKPSDRQMREERMKQRLIDLKELRDKLWEEQQKREEKAKGGKVGLYANINRRKRLGISRPKSKSTISKEAYSNMKKGFPSRGQGKVSKIKITKKY
jgi:hypothetical protein